MKLDTIRAQFRAYRARIAELEQQLEDAESQSNQALEDARRDTYQANSRAEQTRHDAERTRSEQESRHWEIRQLTEKAANASGPFARSDREAALRRLRNL